MGSLPRFLLVPVGGGSAGMGHLTRCLSLSRKLPGEVSIFSGDLSADARQHLGAVHHPEVRVVDALGAETWDLILLDRRETSARELARFQSLGSVACLDEGGDARSVASYLIDALPRLPRTTPPNIASARFLDLPERTVQAAPGTVRTLLLSFGGADEADLTGAMLSAVLDRQLLPASSVTVVQGPLFKRQSWPDGVQVLRGLDSLDGILSGFDLVITHFGLTALSALSMGVPLALFNPTPYHDALARTLGSPRLGVQRVNTAALRSVLKNTAACIAAAERFHQALSKDQRGTLEEHVTRLAQSNGHLCPACGRSGNPIVARFPLRTYRRCPACGILHLESFGGPAKSYDARYFGDEYKKQYGRTYLEDFQAIKESGRDRIALMKSVLRGVTAGTFLDVGCAYGPFLDALREAGLKPFGIDVSEDAVRHVSERLGIPAVTASFEAIERSALPGGPVRGISLWFVIEHLGSLDGCLRKAASLLSEGGVLAFSTPNGRGVSALSDLPAFLQKSPPDHVTVLSPRGLSALLSRYGLRLRKIRVTGHHPERFPGLLGRWAARRRSGRALVGTFSRLARLGDTFEAYAVKETT